MAGPPRFHTLLHLEQLEGGAFDAMEEFAEIPRWFSQVYLRSPKAVRLQSWLVEAMFGQDGEQIPHVENETQTLLHVNRWDPNGEAEILIFGRPNYQEDVAKMIMDLADYFQKRKETTPKEDPAQEAGSQSVPEAACEKFPEATTQQSPVEAPEAATRESPVKVCKETPQQSPVKVCESQAQKVPVEVKETPEFSSGNP